MGDSSPSPSAFVFLVTELVGAHLVTLDMRHLVASRLVVGVENENLGVSILGLVKLTGAEIGVTLEEEL